MDIPGIINFRYYAPLENLYHVTLTLISFVEKLNGSNGSQVIIWDRGSKTFKIFNDVINIMNYLKEIYEPKELKSVTFKKVQKSTYLRLIINLASQYKENHDTNDFIVYILLMSKLVSLSIESQISINYITRAFQNAKSLILKEMFKTDCSIRLKIVWSDKTIVENFIKFQLMKYNSLQHLFIDLDIDNKNNIIFNSMRIKNQQVISHFCEVILNSFLISLHHNSIYNEYTYQSNIILKQLAGPTIDNLKGYESSLLLDIPTDFFVQVNEKDNIKSHLIVALFDCSLEIPPNNMNQSLELFDNSNDNDDENEDNISIEYKILSKFAEIIERSKVTLICCQKRIHPYLKRLLKSKNIQSISNISIRYMGAVQRLSGAIQLATFSASLNIEENYVINPNSLGYIEKVYIENIYEKSYILMKGYTLDTDVNSNNDNNCINNKVYNFKRFVDQVFPFFSETDYAESFIKRFKSMTTILITGPSSLVTNNIQSALESIFPMLYRKLLNPYVLPSGGYWQRFLADKINCVKVNNITYRRALEIYQKVLLYYANLSQKGSLKYFTNIHNMNDINEYLTYGLIDCVDNNMKILDIATDTAITLLSIDEELYISSNSINT